MGLRHTNFYKYHHDKTQIQPACFVSVDTTWTSIIRVGMIGMGDKHCMPVGNDGRRLWTWGNNQRGQLGHDTQGCFNNHYTPTEISATTLNIVTKNTTQAPDAVKFVDSVKDFTVVVTASGAVWACGS